MKRKISILCLYPKIIKNDLNLFYYMNHIFLIKDINIYSYRNNKHQNKKYFCVRCLNSFNSQENLNIKIFV